MNFSSLAIMLLSLGCLLSSAPHVQGKATCPACPCLEEADGEEGGDGEDGGDEDAKEAKEGEDIFIFILRMICWKYSCCFPSCI